MPKVILTYVVGGLALAIFGFHLYNKPVKVEHLGPIYMVKLVQDDKPRGWSKLRDSNVSWGQDFGSVINYSYDQCYTEVVMLTLSPLFNNKPVTIRGINVRPPDASEKNMPRNTVYAIEAHFEGSLDWQVGIAPDAIIGDSFLIYDMRYKI